MKILLVITGLGMGGAERQVCDLADQFVNQGHEVKIIGLTGKMAVHPVDSNVSITMLYMRKSILGFCKAYMTIRSITKQFKPDVVHGHMFHANIMVRLLRLTLPVSKIISTAHNTNEGGILRMFLYRASNFLSNINTNVSQEAVDSFIEKRAFKAGQIFAMANGIDVDKFSRKEKKINIRAYEEQLKSQLKIPEGAFVFIAVGRLQAQKDYPNLLVAFQKFLLLNSDAHLLIVGQGELEDELKQLCKTLNIQNKIHFLGLRRDIPDLLNMADAFVLSSKHEGLPLVVGEAMACEKPVIATDCGGVKEFLGGNGFLCPPQDAQSLANAMKKCMNLSIKERVCMGEKSRAYIIKSYSLNSIANKWIDLYRENI